VLIAGVVLGHMSFEQVTESRDYALSLFSAEGLTPTIRWRVASIEMVRGLVGHGLGYAILATKPANSVTYDGLALAARPLDNTVKGSEMVVAWPGQEPQGVAAERFVAHCLDEFGALP
ncbi:MAG: LysR substrate-binding domain-containing protein, partial [Pseudomonadota bacterium]